MMIASLLLVAACVQGPPNPPQVLQPSVDHEVVHAADVHLETEPMSDPDLGDTHASTDWEIWSLAPLERVWSAGSGSLFELTATQLANGRFENSHAGLYELTYGRDYRMRVRHRDSQRMVSAWSERLFHTANPHAIHPLEIRDVAVAPLAVWKEESGLDVELPFAGDAATLALGSRSARLLILSGQAQAGNAVMNPAAIASATALRAAISGGSMGFLTAASTLTFTNGAGAAVTLYLPSFNLAPGETSHLWFAASGSSYRGRASQIDPDFTTLAAGSGVPWTVSEAGYRVEVAATGFRLPANIAFVPGAMPGTSGPYYYVTELYGKIKVVLGTGEVREYVTGLLNYTPSGQFPGSGEQGVTGITVDPLTGDVFATMLYNGGGANYPKIVHMTSLDGGLTADTTTDLLTMPGEAMGQSHIISHIGVGPDGALYVHVGDGFSASAAANMNSFRGKILRMDLNGNALSDNPFYDAGDGINARDYIYCFRVRNPFGGHWRRSDQRYFCVENGPGIDRLTRLFSGADFGWDGSNGSMLIGAIYAWNPAHGPVNITFVEPLNGGGSGFPASKYGTAYVTESGPTWATGPQSRGKRIVEFGLGSDGSLLSGPTTFVEYNGAGKATAVGLEAGPDGLYFTDLYKDLGFSGPSDEGANVLRVRYVGVADFSSDVTMGSPPFTVQFTSLSDVPGLPTYLWQFGDGNTSTLEHPLHIYTQEGVYDVRLDVTGDGGVVSMQKPAYIVCFENGRGLAAQYYDDADLNGPLLERLDPRIDFQWVFGSPHPSMGPDDFSARWKGQVRSDFSEVFTFHTLTDNAVRLWVDGQLLIDDWSDTASAVHSANFLMQAGVRYDITMEYYERTGIAFAMLEWESASRSREIIPSQNLYPYVPDDVPPLVRPRGLAGEYFDDVNLSVPALNRIDLEVAFDWGTGAPDGSMGADTFSVRWTGTLVPDHTQLYTIFTTTDDGVRLWLNDQLLIDQWVDQTATEHSLQALLAAGFSYDLRIEYYDNTGQASAKLEWASSSTPREVIPSSNLFH